MHRAHDRGRLPVGSAQVATLRTSYRVLNVRTLFDRHHDELYRYLVRLTGDTDLAADIAQETFIRWVERTPANDEPRAWLFKVATNLCRDHGRVTSRRLVLLKESPETVTIGDTPPDPHQTVEAAERQRAVRAVLDALPERDRTLLLMQQEGFSHREMAEAIGTTTGSIGTMLARAMKRFTELAADITEALK